jgi:Ran GTPase-activating protein (RanGAP) involved in mRNA processing and transport
VKLDLYCNLIRDHGLQVVSHLLHLNPSIRIFNIGCNDLSDKAAPYLAEIVSYGHLRSLQVGIIEKSLHPNKLTAITLDAISEAVVKSKSLLSLGMNGTSLSPRQSQANSVSAEAALTRMLSKSTCLKMLRLSNCEITEKAMMTVINLGLRFSASLTRLDISENNIPAVVGVRLSEYLLEPILEQVQGPDPESEPEVVETTQTPHLFSIDASSNAFDTSVATSFASVLTTYPYLGYVDLSNNKIDDDGVVALARALETNQTLVELHLASNRFTSVGGKALAEALRVNETLTTLNISKNKLGDQTGCAIADALQHNTALTILLIASAMLSNQGGIRLAQASPLCPSLLTLDMSDNFFTEESGSAMEKLFADNRTILKIDVSGTQINHFSFHALNQICARNAEMLKLKEEKPMRNQLVKSQYSLVELQRKEAILANLIQQRDDLQQKIDELEEQIRNLKADEEASAQNLLKQIQEKEVQVKNDRVDFEEKMRKMEEDRKLLEIKKAETSSAVEAQKATIRETREKTDTNKAALAKMNKEFETEKAALLKQIGEIKSASYALLKLSQDTEALVAMEQMPEFLEFPEDRPPEPVEPEPGPKPRGKRAGKKKSISKK